MSSSKTKSSGGDANCRKTEKLVCQTLEEQGIAAEVVHVTDPT